MLGSDPDRTTRSGAHAALVAGTAAPRLRRIGVIAHPGRPRTRTLGARLATWASAQDVTLRVLATEQAFLGIAEAETAGPDGFTPGLDLLVALGGDGTLLRAAGLALARDVPVLGVNLGRLGFLTEVEADDLTDALDQIHAGLHRVERRTTLEATLHADGAPPFTATAVNDLVLEKAARQRLAGVELRVGGQRVARYAADGLIVATPTGSTAYSFSAGGPVVSPSLDALMVTPIAPHMVFNRSLVLDAGQVLELEVLPVGPGVVVSADGTALRELRPGALVRVRRGRHDARLVRLGDDHFLSRVRSKFRLADAGVADPPA